MPIGNMNSPTGDLFQNFLGGYKGGGYMPGTGTPQFDSNGDLIKSSLNPSTGQSIAGHFGNIMGHILSGAQTPDSMKWGLMSRGPSNQGPGGFNNGQI